MLHIAFSKLFVHKQRNLRFGLGPTKTATGPCPIRAPKARSNAIPQQHIDGLISGSKGSQGLEACDCGRLRRVEMLSQTIGQG
jgi:hypothetical protein